MVFIYRIHKLDNLKKNCLTRFIGQYRNIKDEKKLFLICHNSDPKTLEFCRRVSEDKDIVLLSLNCDTIKIRNGVEVNSKHCTLYGTSVDLAEEHSGESETIFFIEDDYIFAPDFISKINLFCQNHPEDFVTGLDHFDRYKPNFVYQEQVVPLSIKEDANVTFDIHWKGIGEDYELSKKGYAKYRLELLYESGHHWKTSISSCHTFACNKRAMMKSVGYFYLIDWQKSDHQQWSHLYANNQKLWSSIPGLCVHLGHSNPTEIIWPSWSKEFQQNQI